MPQFENDEGTVFPPIVFGRMSSPRMRENTKAYQTPTILKEWKDSLPAPVAVWFFHECDVIAMEHAHWLDFDQEVGTQVLSEELIGTCYAYRKLLGQDAHHGTWHQGERAYETIRKGQYDQAARVIQSLVKRGPPKDFEKYGNRFVGKKTKDLEPICFSGEGRKLLFG
ncbi:expressed unknown protein [Seminavis robusta]|uniref:Uncharacterized protein n=1 Tax=Seminavis robusta TaxID=568900 RepID=A0A9N8H7V7_9STRA|nr:expressed unknown protein [Seminavis robusta]|eukprot:Sro195_g083260.1 n/a (168) ;mRNA; r:72669-73172